jgi:hypothetical protein
MIIDNDNLALGYLGSLAFRSVREVYVLDHRSYSNGTLRDLFYNSPGLLCLLRLLYG